MAQTTPEPDPRILTLNHRYPRPSQFYYTLTHLLLNARRLFLLHLLPPRPTSLGVHRTTRIPSAEGTYHMNSYDAAPWYVKPTVWNRWGPFALVARLVGAPLPGDGGDTFRPGGYRIDHIGPDALRGKGTAWVEGEMKKVDYVRARGRGGCPFGAVGVE